MRRLTLSKLEDAAECLWPFRPDTPAVPRRSNTWAEIGNAFAEYTAGFINGKPVVVTCEAPELEAYITNWLAWFGDKPYGKAEVAVAIDVITGEPRQLGLDINRKYVEHGAGPNDSCGSCDHVYVQDGVVYVQDWKTGRQRHLTTYKNPQVRAYAAALGLMGGYELVKYRVVVIDTEGVWTPDWESMDVAEMRRVVRSIQTLAEEAELFEPSPTPGMHCQYCDHAVVCPAMADKMRQELAPVVAATTAITSNEQAARVIEQLVQIDAKSKAVWDLVKDYAQENDIALSDGRVYGVVAYPKESIVLNSDSEDLLRERGYDSAVETKLVLTKKSLRDAIKSRVPKGKAAQAEREILNELRQRGSVKEILIRYVDFKENGK